MKHRHTKKEVCKKCKSILYVVLIDIFFRKNTQIMKRISNHMRNKIKTKEKFKENVNVNEIVRIK